MLISVMRNSGIAIAGTLVAGYVKALCKLRLPPEYPANPDAVESPLPAPSLTLTAQAPASSAQEASPTKAPADPTEQGGR